MMHLRLLALVALFTFLHLVEVLAQSADMTAKDQISGSEGQMVSAPAVPPALPADSVTEGRVTLANGTAVEFQVVAGLLTVGSSDDQDAKIGFDGGYLPGAAPSLPAKLAEQPATARMFYTAYFRQGRRRRPGPSSSSTTAARARRACPCS